MQSLKDISSGIKSSFALASFVVKPSTSFVIPDSPYGANRKLDFLFICPSPDSLPVAFSPSKHLNTWVSQYPIGSNKYRNMKNYFSLGGGLFLFFFYFSSCGLSSLSFSLLGYV